MSPVHIPDVAVTDQDNNRLRVSSELLGNDTVIMSFIFTSCGGTCLLIGANFTRIDALLTTSPRPVRIVLVSADPETDTPARLKVWAEQFGSPQTWTLVTGSRDEIDSLSIAVTGSPVAGPRNHVPRAIIGNMVHARWTVAYALDEPTSLLDEADRIGQPTLLQATKESSVGLT